MTQQCQGVSGDEVLDIIISQGCLDPLNASLRWRTNGKELKIHDFGGERERNQISKHIMVG